MPQVEKLVPVIRFIAAKGKVQGGSIQLLCHVKPGVNANREGIATVSDEAIEVCVAAQAREGEANKSVREVIAEALNVPKSDVEIAKGMKSREKTVAVYNAVTKDNTPEEAIERIKIILQESVVR
ncbi:YggU-like protein [Lentithecium fluviatile CBS 122367]|uniref:YggU-like protein n=1 Tax=Lentithecium fluviatile CBS 122367 TaxID=1168545 RepID=A0A6G1JC61_9PLEO|nr:YggU-like protein [Lentithecium fluviatile CBS 122367]